MKRDKFIIYCKNYLASKKIVDEYFKKKRSPKKITRLKMLTKCTRSM